MKIAFRKHDQVSIAFQLLKWTFLVLPVAMTTGVLVAFFLWALEKCTTLRQEHACLLYALPLAGMGIWYLYYKAGKKVAAGSNLILDAIHQPGGGIPARMAPLVLITTLITHLFGGSAGREGTAVQMGGSIAQWYARWFRLTEEEVQVMLTAGMAAGFGAVFGTPVTGAVFALEVLAIGVVRYKALMPCLIAAVVADLTCVSLGIHHTIYHIATEDPVPALPFLHMDVLLLAKVIFSGVIFGLAGYLFSMLLHGIKKYAAAYIRQPWLVPVVGGIIVIVLCWVLDTRDYIGLGVTGQYPDSVSIVNAFHAGGAGVWSWWWKIVFTAVTLGMGFKGGEVTPLFFIGATLGNGLAVMLGVPVDLLAGLGFIAVFGSAANTPLACTLMGVELFGAHHVVYYAVACFTAYYFSGHTGIYGSQRIGINKMATDNPSGLTLQQWLDKKNTE
ncbi:H+/Cl-antiporter ClcA [Chitinophaga costaii]|uniref:H+/Cl-antiporter ClcA n=1 Tax=Chitinophaga costaii TaxID=1335309 RepID=A0A1C4AHH6_9BACT|nr:voltage-gated chloride channel family protein [Chitinophaga costaii]PUZ26604.1 voltage-gated chloride channel protein [Chitinophaga costaii]SCB94027.1 H+/Cl-antiporter ClcA [Chitinophaga costaii]